MAKSMVSVRRTGNRFSEIPDVGVPRSQFDRSHGLKTTFDFDKLIPIMVEEILPGDTMTCSLRGFARLFSPLKAPIMDNMYLDFHFFFVPNRLVWENWERFNGAQDKPTDSTDFTVPTQTYTTCETGSLADYMGIPVGTVNDAIEINALPFRALTLIYNQWFRDENLANSVTVPKTDSGGIGYNAFAATSSFPRAKKHDYFTSALPWPQKPNSQYPNGVTIPLADSAPVLGIGKSSQVFVDGPQTVYESDGKQATYTYAQDLGAFADLFYIRGTSDTDGFPDIQVDLTGATATSINDLREAFQIQRLLEKDARGGTRYVEILKSHFRVTSPDFRLQRPEYLGGGKSYINVSPIAQQSPTQDGAGVAGTPQGHLAATATGVITGNGFAKSFVEHGYVIGVVSARADLTYQQGIARQWSRKTRFDFYWPSLQGLGEQAILNQEIYASDNQVQNEGVFGYQERHAEYRYAPSRVSGKFRSQAAGSLDLWHLAEEFGSLPALNAAFIQSNTPIERVVAVPSEPDIILDLWFQLKQARPMPVYGVPGLIDHF